MKKLLAILILSTSAFGQGGVQSNAALKVTGAPAGGATVRVCTASSTGTPCLALASIYSDSALSISKSNPFTADIYGNYAYFATPGIYKEQVTVGTVTHTNMVVVSPVLGSLQFGSSSSYGSDATGKGTIEITRYDTTSTYSGGKPPFGLPANIGKAIQANIFAPNTNVDRVFSIMGGVQCGTPDVALSTLPASNGKVGGYFYGGATSNGTCAPMGLNAVVAGYPANNTSIYGAEIDWNGNGTDVAANLATAPNYSGIKIASGGPNIGGAWLSTSATSFPTNGVQYGIVNAHWLQDGYVCLYSTGATGTTCYYAAPAGAASTNLGSQKASTSLAMQDHRWNGASDSADIYTMLLNPNSGGTDSCWELRNGAGTAITKSCGLFAGLAAQFGESTSIAAHFLKNTITEGCTNGSPCHRITPSVTDSGVAIAVSDSGNSANRTLLNFDGSASFGGATATISAAGKGTFNAGVAPSSTADAITWFKKATHASVDLASVATAACTSETTETITGAALGDSCTVSAGTALEAGGFFRCAVTATDTAKWQFCNLSGGNIDRASDTYTIRVTR